MYKTPNILSSIFPKYLWHMPREGKKIYLTFDDGPIPEVTSWVLQQLDIYQAKATFFCVGDNVLKHPDIAQKIAKSGHSIANHTMHHLKGWKTPLETYLQDVALCQKEIGALHTSSNFPNPLFRPPYGRISKNQGKALFEEYQVIMWEILTHDYDQRINPAVSLRKAIKYTLPGSIIVFHDSLKAKKNLYHILPKYLQHFSQQGFVFERL